MKRIFFTIFILLVAFSSSFAQSRSRSIIKFRLSDDSRLAVSIDGRYYDKQGRSITIGDLPQGSHYIKIYQYIPYSNGRGGKAREIYRGGIKISSGTITEFNYDVRKGKLYASTEFIDESYREGDHNDEDGDYRDRRDDDRRRNDDVYYSRQWSQQDMSDLKKRVDDRMMDGDKVKLMQSVLQDRRYTTEQMRTMLNWLSFEDSKLTVAKWGYDNVTDKQNYWKLESEFTFSSSKDEFNNHINGRK